MVLVNGLERLEKDGGPLETRTPDPLIKSPGSEVVTQANLGVRPLKYV